MQAAVSSCEVGTYSGRIVAAVGDPVFDFFQPPAAADRETEDRQQWVPLGDG